MIVSYLMSVEQYQVEIDRIKSNADYIKLSRMHRGELEQKNFDKFRLKIANLEAKIKALQPAVTKTKPVARRAVPVRHPVNPALARMAAEPLPGARGNDNIIINKTKMAPNRTEHDKIVQSGQVDALIQGTAAEIDDLALFDDIAFDEEPLPDGGHF